jgi:hypothetical protein
MSIKTIDIISCICAVLSIVLVGLACFVPIIFTNEAFSDRFVFDETGQIGDTIGGTMSPVVAIAGVFMTFIAFLMQVNANRIQSEQLCTTDGKGRVTNISVNFSKAEHIAANCPYIIKVSKPVTEFTLENEYLIPAEEPAVTVNGDKFIGGAMQLIQFLIPEYCYGGVDETGEMNPDVREMNPQHHSVWDN